MWGRDPKDLEAALAIKRMELRYDDRQSLFGDEWQGLPVHGYSFLLKSMIRQIPLRLNTAQFNPADYDVVVFSGPIDQFFKYRYGKLEYRSLRFYYRRNERWENNNYGTINLPQHSLYIRKCNFKVMHKQITKQSLIQYQKPVEEDDNHMPMYPVRSRKNSQAFDKYLHLICKTHICPIGRLGLFSYLNMDQVVELSFSILSIINKYPVLTPQQRYDKIKNAIKKYNNLENKK